MFTLQWYGGLIETFDTNLREDIRKYCILFSEKVRFNLFTLVKKIETVSD